MTRRTATIAVVASAACFATLGIFTKWAFMHGAEPTSLLAVRFALAAAVMGIAQAVIDPGALRISRGDVLRCLALALTGYGMASLCYSFAVGMIGASVTTVLLYTYPAMVSIIGWLFLREAFPPKRAAAVVLTFFGSALVVEVFTAAGSLNVPGLLLGLGAALGYAIFNVLSYRTMKRVSRLALMTYTFAFAAGALAAIGAATGSLANVAEWDGLAWASVIAIVAIPTFAAVMLYLGGVRRMGAAQAAVVSTLELPFTVAFAALAFPTERLSLLQLLGAAIVLAGVLLAEWGAPTGEVEGIAAV